MTILLTEGIITCINYFPSKGGAKNLMSPVTVVLGKANPNYNKKRIVFGEYTLVYTGTKNNIKRSSIPAIFFRESNYY